MGENVQFKKMRIWDLNTNPEYLRGKIKLKDRGIYFYAAVIKEADGKIVTMEIEADSYRYKFGLIEFYLLLERYNPKYWNDKKPGEKPLIRKKHVVATYAVENVIKIAKRYRWEGQWGK